MISLALCGQIYDSAPFGHMHMRGGSVQMPSSLIVLVRFACDEISRTSVKAWRTSYSRDLLVYTRGAVHFRCRNDDTDALGLAPITLHELRGALASQGWTQLGIRHHKMPNSHLGAHLGGVRYRTRPKNPSRPRPIHSEHMGGRAGAAPSTEGTIHRVAPSARAVG